MTDDAFHIVKDGAAITTVDEWLAAAPPRGGAAQWRDGRSAKACAEAWCNGGRPRVPDEVAALLASHPHTAGARMQWARPEHRVRFDRLRGEVRNADLVALARDEAGRVAVSVEAKADEPFGRPVRAVLDAGVARIAADERTHVVTRVQLLGRALLPPPWDGAPPLGALRYQLLTAVAGALAFAAEVGATRAVLVVHEFVTDATHDARHAANAADLDAFWARLAGRPGAGLAFGTLAGPVVVPGNPDRLPPLPLYVGKARRVTRAAAASAA